MEELQRVSYYGSAQVGHLYFLGSALQTPQRTSDVVLFICGDLDSKAGGKRRNACRRNGCAERIKDDVRNHSRLLRSKTRSQSG